MIQVSACDTECKATTSTPLTRGTVGAMARIGVTGELAGLDLTVCWRAGGRRSTSV